MASIRERKMMNVHQRMAMEENKSADFLSKLNKMT